MAPSLALLCVEKLASFTPGVSDCREIVEWIEFLEGFQLCEDMLKNQI
jgi:hypothetical protein